MGYNGGMKNRLIAIIGGVLAVVLVAVLVAVFVFWPNTPAPTIYDGMKVYAFNAGKADSFLIYNADFAVLIDTGEKELGDTIIEYLNANNIKKLDYLVITHFDKDHVGSASKIIDEVDVGKILQSNYPKESKVYARYLEEIEDENVSVETVREDLKFTLGDVCFAVNAPAEEEYVADPSNNSSLIVSVYYGETSWLFMGDAEDLRLSEWLAINDEQYDFIKVPYHGHYQARLGDLAAETAPKYAVITSSEEEMEDDSTVSIFEDAGAKVYLLRKGALLFSTDGENIATSR